MRRIPEGRQHAISQCRDRPAAWPCGRPRRCSVTTFIASENETFEADPSTDLSDRTNGVVDAGLEFSVQVILRTAAEAADAADSQPFGADENRLEIWFLPTEPEPATAATLLKTTALPDRLTVMGREVDSSHIGPRTASDHTEARVVRLLGMATSQRNATTVRRVSDRCVR